MYVYIEIVVETVIKNTAFLFKSFLFQSRVQKLWVPISAGCSANQNLVCMKLLGVLRRGRAGMTRVLGEFYKVHLTHCVPLEGTPETNKLNKIIMSK
jgi:hypothetical protein